MIPSAPPFDPQAPIVVIDIGNTAIKVATWYGDELKTPLSVPLEDQAGFEETYAAHFKDAPAGTPAATVVASVVPKALARVKSHVISRSNNKALVVGDVLPLPLEVAVADPRAVGVDRVCAAAAAYNKLQTGCTIVDFGSAVTVDLVNDEGTLLGGAILPGVGMQLRALHELTATLPKVERGIPELPFGRNTVEAIQNGVCRGIAGAVRALVEGYATHLNHWSQVVATGGDATLLAPHCDFIDTLVRDLALRGIGLAYTKHLTEMGA